MNNASKNPDWRDVVNALPDAAIVIDRAGIVVHHNPLIADLFPRARVGNSVTLISREPALLRAIQTISRDRARIFVRLHDRVPVERQLTAIVTPLDSASDERGSASILIIFRDLSDEERHARLRADFVANASHELRTPLSALKLIIETMQGAGRDDIASREKFLARMSSQADRMTQLINDLMSLNRVEMRAHLTPRDSVDIVDLLVKVAATLEPMAEASDIAINLPADRSEALVIGDYDELWQVFLNLIQNAIRYGRAGGSVTLEIAPAVIDNAHHLSISVSDTGPGIAPEHLPRLTERFYRVSATASRDKGGTGLGLAIVKHIVTRHRGELRITSELERGSTFTVVLPADKGQSV